MASRTKPAASRALDGVAAAGAPPAAQGWLGPALWTALLRHAIPVIGVLFLGWAPLDYLLFVAIETWLFLTLRMGVEGALNRSFGPQPKTLAGALLQIALLSALCGAVMAVVLGLVAAVVRQFAISAADWEQFVQAAVWRTAPFQVALGLLFVEQLWDAVRFAIRIAPLPAPEQADDLHLQRMVLRIVFLGAAGFAAGLTPARGAGSRAVVIALAAAMVLLEAWPEEHVWASPDSGTAAALRAPQPATVSGADARAASPRRSRRRRGRSPRA